MAELVTEPTFADMDAAFRLLAMAHRGMDAGQSAALNARLVLILANHVGNMDVLKQALDIAAKAKLS
jgi:hypothetical protein